MNSLSSPIEVIRKSIKIFFDKTNFIFFLRVYSLLLPFTVITYIVNNYLKIDVSRINSEGMVSIFSQYPWFVGIYLLIGIIYLVVSFWVAASGIVAVSSVTQSKIMSFKDVYEQSKKILIPYSVLSIVLALITGLGFILLIVPGILLMVWYSFAGFELVTKKTGIKASMAQSKSLVVGKFWKICGRLILFGLFSIVAQIIFSLIPYNFGSVISPLFGALFVLPYFLLYGELSKK